MTPEGIKFGNPLSTEVKALVDSFSRFKKDLFNENSKELEKFGWNSMGGVEKLYYENEEPLKGTNVTGIKLGFYYRSDDWDIKPHRDFIVFLRIKGEEEDKECKKIKLEENPKGRIFFTGTVLEGFWKGGVKTPEGSRLLDQDKIKNILSQANLAMKEITPEFEIYDDDKNARKSKENIRKINRKFIKPILQSFFFNTKNIKRFEIEDPEIGKIGWALDFEKSGDEKLHFQIRSYKSDPDNLRLAILKDGDELLKECETSLTVNDFKNCISDKVKPQFKKIFMTSF